jgi:hypothetical protein
MGMATPVAAMARTVSGGKAVCDDGMRLSGNDWRGTAYMERLARNDLHGEKSLAATARSAGAASAGRPRVRTAFSPGPNEQNGYS